MSPATRAALACAIALACSPVLANELRHGVSDYDVEDVRYLASTTSTRAQARTIADAVPDLEGEPAVRRVTFDYEGDDVDEPFAVRGILFGWENLRVARYRLADLEQSVLFANHDRDQPDAPRVVEARTRTVLVISGPDADDPELVAAVRELAWPGNAPKRTDLLGYQEDGDNLLYRFSDEAKQASPFLEALLGSQAGMIDMIPSYDPSAVLTVDGDERRLVTDDGIVTLGPNALALFEDPEREAAFTHLLEALDPSAEPSSDATPGASGGMTGALDGANAEALPWEITEAHAGKTFKARVNDEVLIDLASNPSTGYSWKHAQATTRIELVDSEFYLPGGPGPVGSGGRRAFTYRARTAGTQVVTLHYTRGGAPAGTFTVTIVVE